MHARYWLPLLSVSLVACATLPATRDTPFLPPGVFGVYEDNDIGALNTASWAFASAANTSGNPAEAARAVVALEYLSGELRENPRWVSMDAAIKLHITQARNQLRQILGIPPEVPPQIVVNTLLALALDLQTGNQPAAMRVLAAPMFTQPPDRTLQVLSHLPYVQEANLATSRAEDQSFGHGGAWR